MSLKQGIISILFTVVANAFVHGQGSRNLELLARWSSDTLIANSSKVRYSDCFGFTYHGNEYAVIGSTEGTHVFHLTSQNELIPKGFIPGRFQSTSVQHREYAVYQNYLYAVCDEGVSSLQIIDFQYLPDSITLAFEDTVQFGRVHNVFIDTVQAKLYSCIHRSTVNTQTIAAPLKVFSLTDPLHLTELWSGPNDVNEVHDIYVRNGKAILNCGFDGLRVYDFTNTLNPSYLDSKTFYQEQGYNHQGWLTPDGNTYIFADETNGKRVKRCSFDGTTVQIINYFGTNYQNGSVPHNIKATDDFAFVAYYNEGLRVFDLRTTVPSEIAFYDTYPEQNAYKMNGNWGVFIDLPSKRILAADRQYGLFVLKFEFETMTQGFPLEQDFQLYPNPISSSESLTVFKGEGKSEVNWRIVSLTGSILKEGAFDQNDYLLLQLDYSQGIYRLEFTYTDTSGETGSASYPLIIL